MSKSKEQINVLLIDGDFAYTSDILNKIKNKLGEYDEEVFEGIETFSYMKSSIYSNDCFAEKRLFVLRDFPLYNTTQPTFMKHFKQMLENVPSDVFVVLNNIPGASEKFVNWVGKIGKVFKSDKYIPEDKAPAFVMKALAGHDKSMELGDAEMLADSIGLEGGEWRKGVSVDRLTLSIKRLVDYVGNRKKITQLDVEKACSDSPAFVTFSLFRKFENKDYLGAMKIFQQACLQGKDVKSVFVEILYSARSYYSLMFFLKESLGNGMSSSDICNDIRQLHKFSRTGRDFYMKFDYKKTTDGKDISRFSEKYVNTVLTGRYGQKPPVQCYARHEIANILKAIDQTMLKVRGGCGENELLILFDLFCMTACRCNVPMSGQEKIREMNDGRFA